MSTKKSTDKSDTPAQQPPAQDAAATAAATTAGGAGGEANPRLPADSGTQARKEGEENPQPEKITPDELKNSEQPKAPVAPLSQPPQKVIE
jgi:hypothetical protein